MRRFSSARLARWCFLATLALAISFGAIAAPASQPFDWADKAAQSPEMSSALKIFLGLTTLSFIPALLICMTSFLRITVVLSLLRHAIGLTDTPPNVVIITLALFLTLFSMQPVLTRVNAEGLQPYIAGELKTGAAVERATQPLRNS